MQRSAADRVKRARIALVLDAPFFGVLASRLLIVEDPSCETMWTDGVSVGYNPPWVDEQSDSELKGTWVHEVLHVANEHNLREGKRDHEEWNEACDYAINPIAEAAGFTLPQGVLLNPAYKGMPAELIYEKIKTGKPKAPPQQSAPQPSKDGKGDDSGNNSDSKDDASGKSGAPSKKPGKGKGKAGKGSEDGQGSSGAQDGDSSPKPPKAAGEVRPAPAGVDKKALASDWKVAISNAATFAAAQGDMPGYLKDFLDEVQKPKVDWKEVLWQFVQESIYSPDYKWTRPNRNYLPSGIYLPTLVGEEMPDVVVAEDTSYSVHKALTLQFRGEFGAIVEQMRPRRIHHLQADTRITKVTEMEPGDEFSNEVAGRGGTDFRPVFNWVEKEGHTPACLVYMSDLEGPFPVKEPDYPVLWLCPPGTRINPPWGTKLEIPFDQYK